MMKPPTDPLARRGVRKSRQPRDGEGTPPACAVFIAYDEVGAARDAMGRLRRMLRTPHGEREFLPMLWRFDQLDDSHWRETSLREAGRAAAIVLALSENRPIRADAEAWLSALVIGQRGAPLHAFVFIGANETWTISLRQTQVVPRNRGTAAMDVTAGRATTVAAPPKDATAACAA